MTSVRLTISIIGMLIGLSASGQQLPRIHVVHLPIHSYRLLAMSMDENGDIWFGSIHHVVHRYNPRTGAVETIALHKTTANYNFWASQSLPLNKKVYFLGEVYPNLLIYDPARKTFAGKPYPSPKPDVWYASQDNRHLYLIDRVRENKSGIRWQTQPSERVAGKSARGNASRPPRSGSAGLRRSDRNGDAP